jgi:hypothetical protein
MRVRSGFDGKLAPVPCNVGAPGRALPPFGWGLPDSLRLGHGDGDSQRRRERRRLGASACIATAAHAALLCGAIARHSRHRAPETPGAMQDVLVDLEPLPSPPLRTLSVDTVGTAVLPGRGRDTGTAGRSSRTRGAPSPPPAKASAVVAPAEATSTPAVAGTAPAFVGGFTSPSGTSDLFVGDPHAADALLYGDGSGGGGSISPPRLGGYVHWDCPWPAEAAGIDHAVAHVVAEVDAQGRAVGARLVDDPGSGFGPRAIACALRHRYIPGHDGVGRPVAGETRPFAVRFDRDLETWN